MSNLDARVKKDVLAIFVTSWLGDCCSSVINFGIATNNEF